MFVQVLYGIAAAAGLVLAVIGAVALPEATIVWVGVGVLVGTVTWLSVRSSSTGDSSGRAAGLAAAGAAGAAAAGALALTGLAVLLGAASGLVIVVLLLLVAPFWLWRRRRDEKTVPDADDRNATRRHEDLPALPRLPPVVPSTLSTSELCLAWQLPRDARATPGACPMRDRAGPRGPARRDRATRPRRVHPLARDRRPCWQRPRPLSHHRPLSRASARRCVAVRNRRGTPRHPYPLPGFDTKSGWRTTGPGMRRNGKRAHDLTETNTPEGRSDLMDKVVALDARPVDRACDVVCSARWPTAVAPW